MKTVRLLAVSILTASLMSAAALAQQPVMLARDSITEQFVGSRLSFSADQSLSNFTLRVSGPDGYHGEVQSARIAPTFRLADFGSTPDGLYTYEITAATTERRVLATPQADGANGRPGRARPGLVGTSVSGSFRVVNGQILQMDSAASER